jgi:hypothetical protein
MTTKRDNIVAAIAATATIGSVFVAAFVAAWGWNFGQLVWGKLF